MKFRSIYFTALCGLLASAAFTSCIAEALDMTHSAISHQLRLLRASNLVKFTKDGKEVIYSLDDSHVLSLFDQALDHVKHKISER